MTDESQVHVLISTSLFRYTPPLPPDPSDSVYAQLVIFFVSNADHASDV